MSANGIIVILSYPDTVVCTSYWEFWSKLWPKIGIGNKNIVKAGHSAVLLIEKNKHTVDYYDFGRYITSYGNGRVRSKETDPELEIPIKITFKNNKLTNLNELLLWLDKHPEKTHGNGRLIASVNNIINYQKAKKYVDDLIERKEIPYGAFLKNGNNCARFVTQLIINSCIKKKIQLKLKSSFLLTPSPIGNVIKGKTEKTIYQVLNQKISEYKNRSITKEYKLFFTTKFNTIANSIGTQLPNKRIFNLTNGTWLAGIGSGAWFNIENQISKNKYTISKYNYKGDKEFEDIFKTDNSNFIYQKQHQFTYPSSYKECAIIQNNQKILFKRNSKKN